jgi:hypothetical protein
MPKSFTYYFCYEFGYLPLPQEQVLLVVWQPAVMEPKGQTFISLI